MSGRKSKCAITNQTVLYHSAIGHAMCLFSCRGKMLFSSVMRRIEMELGGMKVMKLKKSSDKASCIEH